MPKSADLPPRNPDSYAPRPDLISGWTRLVIPGAFIAVFIVSAVRSDQSAVLFVASLMGLVLIGSVAKRWRAQPPVLIDQPGINFADIGDGSRLVPWESITAVVLFEIPRTDTTRRGWQSAIGVHLVGHPDGVSVQRPLGGWKLDRAALERAVTRFGPGVKVLDGPRTGIEPDAPTLGQFIAMARLAAEQHQQAEAARSAAEPGSPEAAAPRAETSQAWTPERGAPGAAPVPGTKQPRIIWHRTAHYRPADPGAHLARFDLRSNLGFIVAIVAAQVFLWAVVVPEAGAVGVIFALIFAAPLVFMWRTLRSGGAVGLAIDRPGVFFGESHSPGDDQDHRLVPWSDISAVVVYDQLVDGSKSDKWQRAVGVRLRGEPTAVRHWRIIAGWKFNRPAIEAAVARFAPGVPVIDGPPQRRHR
jgi:hypothetical protein